MAHSGNQRTRRGTGSDLRQRAWQWALEYQAVGRPLPSGREIARQYGRHERWGRLVKRAGLASELGGGRSRQVSAKLQASAVVLEPGT
jgi:hypothetical protein